MSSQGPSTGTNVNGGASGCFGPSIMSQVSTGYAFDKDALRDGSDWIQYKKRQIILKEIKTKNFQDPWFVRGNQYRLDYLGGLAQNGAAPGCAGCTSGGAYNSNGPFST